MAIYMEIKKGNGKIGEIPGESKDDGHKDWIELLSLSWGATNPGSFAMGGGGSKGRSQLHDLSVVVNESIASPKLLQACVSGEHFGEVTVDFQKAGGDQEVYMTWILQNVMVSSYNVSGSGEDNPVCDVAFNFEKIKYTYKQQDEKGKASKPVEATWDQGTNKPI